MGIPVIESRSEAVSGAANVTSLVITAPTGIADGDVLIIALATDGDVSSTFVLPSGFLTITEQADTSGSANTQLVIYKVADGESGNYTVSWTGAQEAIAEMYRISGASGTPIQDPAEESTATSSTPTITPVASTDQDDCLIIAIHSMDSDKATISPSGDADYTLEDVEESGGTSTTACSIAVHSREEATAAVPPACTFTYGNIDVVLMTWFVIRGGAAAAGGINYRSMSQSIAHSIVRPIST